MRLEEYKWIFETPIKYWVKFFLNKIGTSRYVVKGKCKKCGKCCETILFSDENGYIKNEEEFKKLKNKSKRYKHFEISGRVKDKEYTLQEFNDRKNIQGALYFRCKSLGSDKKCKNYFFRSLYCRDYPSINELFISNGGETLDGCGYHFEVNKKFEEYLK